MDAHDARVTMPVTSALQGMGPMLSADGVAFRVWAPHAKQVSVIGTFNNWDGLAHPMQSGQRGFWYAEVKGAGIGDQCKYQVSTDEGVLKRIDPYARELTSSVGNAIVHDSQFNWEDDDFSMPSWNTLVIYELHVGTFNDEDPYRPEKFISITASLGHLKQLGVNAIQIMPVGQFAGMRSWGYNPSHLFAVDSDYGGSLRDQAIRQASSPGRDRCAA